AFSSSASFKRLVDRFPFRAICQHNLDDRSTILAPGRCTDGTVALVHLQRRQRGVFKRAFGAAHDFGLLAGLGQVLTFSNRDHLGDGTTHVVNNNFRIGVTTRGVDRELRAFGFELELARNRGAFACARAEASFERYIGLLYFGGEGGVLILIAVVLREEGG